MNNGRVKKTKVLDLHKTCLYYKITKKLAFTLAEVLITLGIIGVVAALTIPTLLSNAEKHALYNQYMANYSILQQATALMRQEYGGDLSNQFATIDELGATLAKYLKITRICPGGATNSVNCWNSGNMRNLTNDMGLAGWTNNPFSGRYWPVLYLPSGAKVGIEARYFESACDGTDNYFTDGAGKIHYTCANIFIDVNGDKEPDQMGKDVQVFLLTPDMPLMNYSSPGTKQYTNDGGYNLNCNPATPSVILNGRACSAKMFAEKKMDY